MQLANHLHKSHPPSYQHLPVTVNESNSHLNIIIIIGLIGLLHNCTYLLSLVPPQCVPTWLHSGLLARMLSSSILSWLVEFNKPLFNGNYGLDTPDRRMDLHDYVKINGDIIVMIIDVAFYP